MDINNKIVVCLHCSYFPTKVDQFTTPSINIGHQSIQWLCPACEANNKYPRELVMLPSTRIMRVTPQNLLHPTQIKINRCLVIINSLGVAEIAYFAPQTTPLLKKYKIETEKLQTFDQLAAKSAWLTHYRKKRRGLCKFRRELQIDSKAITKDQYSIYLLETYLKNLVQMNSKNNQRSLVVDFLLDAKGERFSFQIKSLSIEEELSHFLMIHLLGSLDFYPGWLRIFYQDIIQKHTKHIKLAQSYHTILMFCSQAQNKQQILLFQQPKLINFTQLSSKSFTSPPALFQGKFTRFRIEPYLDNSFSSYLQEKSAINSFPESITVFWLQRRSTTIKTIKLCPVPQLIRDILLSNQDQIDEDKLKVALMRELELVKGKIFLKLIKLNYTFYQKEEIYHMLYTFDWASIQSKTMYSSLQEPSSYQDRLMQNIQPKKHLKKETINPFSKKQKALQAFLTTQLQVEEQDDGYISL